MQCLFPNSIILIHCLRIFGHFPYRWTSNKIGKNDNTKSSFDATKKIIHGTVDGKQYYSFTSSYLLKIWSVLFSIVTTALVIYSASQINSVSKTRTYNIATLRVPYIISDSLIYITLLLMNFLSLKNSDKLCQILNKANFFLSTTKIDMKKRWISDISWVAPYVVLVAILGTLVIVAMEQGNLFKSIYHLCFYEFVLGTSFLLVSVYSSLFYGILSTVGTLYEVIFSEFTTYSKHIEEKFCNSPLQINCKKNEVSEAFTTVASGTSLNSGAFLESFKKDELTPGNKITINAIRRCKISLLQLYSYKRLITEFFEVMIVIFMVELISSTIISLFYISILNNTLLELSIPICYSISNLLPLLCLLNASHKVNKQVSKMKFLLFIFNVTSKAIFKIIF